MAGITGWGSATAGNRWLVQSSAIRIARVVLLHLRDQLLALERIADLCDGVFVTAEEYDRPSELIPFPVARYHADRDKDVVFWLPSAKAWRRMLWTAGFDHVERKARFTMRSRKGFSVPVVVHHAHKHA